MGDDVDMEYGGVLIAPIPGARMRVNVYLVIDSNGDVSELEEIDPDTYSVPPAAGTCIDLVVYVDSDEGHERYGEVQIERQVLSAEPAGL